MAIHRFVALALLAACTPTTRAPPAGDASVQGSGGAGPAAQPVAAPPLLSLEKPETEPKSPGLEVELPPKRDLRGPEVPAVHEDGAYSIRGLREDPDALLAEGEGGREILVRAYVQEIYAPPPCPPGVICPMGKMPHVWVTDAPGLRGKRHAMMVVNYAFAIPEFQAATWKDAPHVVFQVGEPYTFKGKFVRFSDTGFADERGLLDFIAYKGEDGAWIYPPGAPWHPLSLAQVEAATRRDGPPGRRGGTN